MPPAVASLGSPALATPLHRTSVLSKVHRIKDPPNPCQNEAVRELLAKTRQAYAKRGAMREKRPTSPRNPLEAILAGTPGCWRRAHKLLRFPD